MLQRLGFEAPSLKTSSVGIRVSASLHHPCHPQKSMSYNGQIRVQGERLGSMHPQQSRFHPQCKIVSLLHHFSPHFRIATYSSGRLPFTPPTTPGFIATRASRFTTPSHTSRVNRRRCTSYSVVGVSNGKFPKPSLRSRQPTTRGPSFTLVHQTLVSLPYLMSPIECRLTKETPLSNASDRITGHAAEGRSRRRGPLFTLCNGHQVSREPYLARTRAQSCGLRASLFASFGSHCFCLPHTTHLSIVWKDSLVSMFRDPVGQI